MKIKLWLIVVSLFLQGCTYEAYNAVKPEPKAPDFVGSFIQFRILSALVSGSIKQTSFNYPRGLTTDSNGNIYVADSENNKIRKISPAGVVTTLAGSGLIGSIDGTGISASFYTPYGVVVDSSGTTYVAEYNGSKIRKITSSGVVSTLAGNGTFLFAGTDGIGTAASFSSPSGIAIDSNGVLYVTDYYRSKIRRVTSTGVVTTLAGSGVDGNADGTGSSASFDSPYGIAVDSNGNSYVADSRNNKIRKISQGGIVTTFAGSGIPGSTDAVGTAASFYFPTGIVIDSSGNLYVADYANNKIRKISPGGVVTTFVGSGISGSTDGTGTAASFNKPFGLAIDSFGNFFVSDAYNNRIRKITSSGVVTTFATAWTE